MGKQKPQVAVDNVSHTALMMLKARLKVNGAGDVVAKMLGDQYPETVEAVSRLLQLEENSVQKEAG